MRDVPPAVPRDERVHFERSDVAVHLVLELGEARAKIADLVPFPARRNAPWRLDYFEGPKCRSVPAPPPGVKLPDVVVIRGNEVLVVVARILDVLQRDERFAR